MTPKNASLRNVNTFTNAQVLQQIQNQVTNSFTAQKAEDKRVHRGTHRVSQFTLQIYGSSNKWPYCQCIVIPCHSLSCLVVAMCNTKTFLLMGAKMYLKLPLCQGIRKALNQDLWTISDNWQTPSGIRCNHVYNGVCIYTVLSVEYVVWTQSQCPRNMNSPHMLLTKKL